MKLGYDLAVHSCARGETIGATARVRPALKGNHAVESFVL